MLLENPNKQTIVQTLEQFRSRITAADNLLIFYAGHGLLEVNEGYWLPSDAAKNVDASWISNTAIRAHIKAINSRHTLLISDACFSGSMTVEMRVLFDKPFAELHKLRSRKAMTSSTKTTVPDQSVFFKYLTVRLQENLESWITAEELFTSFRVAVIADADGSATPQYRDIDDTGDQGGEFIFVRRK
jgi:hypothetical protein